MTSPASRSDPPRRRSVRPLRAPAPPRRSRRIEGVFALTGVISALVPLLAVLLAVAAALAMAWPSLRVSPFALLGGTTWDPARSAFGALPLLIGTLVTSAIALLIAIPIALGAALWMAELSPPRARPALDLSLDLMAAVPSVVWGLFALDALLPRLGGPQGGFSLLGGGLVLAVMIVPTIATVAREVLRGVPAVYREAALALGATRWEVVRLAVLPSVGGGLLGAVLLGLGRALGEATAMAMVLGARMDMPESLEAPGYSAAALLLDQVGEAIDPGHVAALGHVALALLAVSMVSHATARVLVDRATRRRTAAGDA
jgi:phosphate transport system permease protein